MANASHQRAYAKAREFANASRDELVTALQDAYEELYDLESEGAERVNDCGCNCTACSLCGCV